MNRRKFLSSRRHAARKQFARWSDASFMLLGSRAYASAKADYSLSIEACTLDIKPGVSIKTTAYNGQVPGPLLRMREGVPVSIDVKNATSSEDIVHWHGLGIDSLNDGAMEEGSPMIPAGATHRYSFTPKPSGTRWYHTHATANDNLSFGTYTGQFGFLLVEGQRTALDTMTRKLISQSITGSPHLYQWSRLCASIPPTCHFTTGSDAGIQMMRHNRGAYVGRR